MSEQRGTGLDVIGAVIWYSVFRVLPAEGGAERCCRRKRGRYRRDGGVGRER